MPPSEAMLPICSRTEIWTSLKRASDGTAEGGWSPVDRVAKANGRCPLRASGTPTTQHSAMSGWDAMACSIDPVK